MRSLTTHFLLFPHLSLTLPRWFTFPLSITLHKLPLQLSVIEDKHTNHVHNIRDRHTQEIATLHREHEDQRNQLILSHQQEIARMEVCSFVCLCICSLQSQVCTFVCVFLCCNRRFVCLSTCPSVCLPGVVASLYVCLCESACSQPWFSVCPVVTYNKIYLSKLICLEKRVPRPASCD